MGGAAEPARGSCSCARTSFPEVATLLEDFHNTAVNSTLDRINRYLLRNADGIIALGDRMRRRLVEEKGADPSRVHVIHNWADCDAIVPGPKDNAFSREHGLVGRFVLMHSGNVGLSQNLEVLVEAADRLRSKERLTIAIVGDGSKRRGLEAMAAARGLTNVCFLPYQPKALLHDSFASADAFLVSLKAGIEGFIVPSKVYGILAAGRPYIAATDPSSEAGADRAREWLWSGGCAGRPRRARRRNRHDVRRPCDDERHGHPCAAGREAVRSANCSAGVSRPVRACGRRGARGVIKRAFDCSLSGLGLSCQRRCGCDRGRDQVGGPRAGVLPAVARRARRAPFRCAEVPIDGAGRGREDRTGAGGGQRSADHAGRPLMRATAMDELPQLWNIFAGEMSFVGPRPLRPGEVDVRGDGQLVSLDQIPGYADRHSVRPGLTGLTQVYAARDISRTSKFRLDRVYLRRAGFWLDMKLILLSFWITGTGAWEKRDRRRSLILRL